MRRTLTLAADCVCACQSFVGRHECEVVKLELVDTEKQQVPTRHSARSHAYRSFRATHSFSCYRYELLLCS